MSTPVTEFEVRLREDMEPDVAGFAYREHRETNNWNGQTGSATDWGGVGWTQTGYFQIEQYRRHSERTSPSGYEIREEDEACWLAYRIDALPPAAFGLTIGLRGEFTAYHFVDTESGGSTLDLNPSAAIVFSGVAFHDYTMAEAQEPTEVVSLLVGADAKTTPEWGRLRFDQFSFDEFGFAPYQTVEVAFPTLADELRAAADEIGLPLWVTFRVWIDPQDMKRVLVRDDGLAREEEAFFGFDFFGEGHFPPPGETDLARLPKLTLTMTCPEPEEPVPFPPIAVGAPAGIPRDRLPAESIRRLAPTLADPRIHIPARLKRHSRRRVRR